MSTSLHPIKVFVASPGDVAEERGRLPAIVERVNRRVARAAGLHLQLWRWEEDAVPGLGEPQTLINPEVDQADIVVLLLWSRLGTPTARAASGTVEELERAFERWERTGRPRVLPYHCRRKLDPFTVDLDQLAGVKALVTQLQKKALLKTYTTVEELEQVLEDHLGAVAREIAAERAAPAAVRAARPRPPADPWPEHLTWLVEEFSEIRVAGFAEGNVPTLPMGRVFVPLHLLVRRDDERGGRKGSVDAADVAMGHGGLTDLLRRTRWALVGDPGAGKTTVLRYIAWRLARHHRGLDDDAPAALGFEGEAPRPLFLSLPQIADQLRERLGPKRPDVRRADWLAVLRWRLEGDPEPALKAGNVLVLFDSLDEVADPADRRWLAAAIRHLAHWFPGPAHSPNRFGLACRTRAWGDDADFVGFEVARLRPLDTEQVREFVEKWFGVVSGGAPDLRDGLLGTIRSNASVRRIATNPQLLTMLCALYLGQRSLPEARAMLYRQVVDHLLRAHREALKSRGGEYRVRRLLRKLAWHMHAGAPDEPPRDTLSLEDAARWLAREADDHDVDRARHEFLHDLEVHTGLLTTEGPYVRFIHRTFQEFLVAEHLASLERPARSMGPNAYEPTWAEVVGLTAGVIAESNVEKLTRYLADLAGDGGGDLAARARRVATAALCLVDLEAYGLSEDDLRPVHEGLAAVMPVLEDPRHDAPNRVRIEVANGLGRVRDPRLREEDRWVDLPAGTFWRGAAEGDEDAFDDERPAGPVDLWAFRIHRWPVTVQEYRPFVEVGYRDREWWSPEGWDWREKEDILAPKDWGDQLAHSNHPVVGVSWYEAVAFCNWLNATDRGDHRRRGWIIRLPTEAEWERAARGLLPASPDARKTRRFPWGDDPPEGRCNFELRYRGTTPVGVFPLGNSPDGLWDCAGNVWEWSIEPQVPYEQPTRPNPYAPVTAKGRGRAFRGGAWRDVPGNCRVSFRYEYAPEVRFADVGFRPVAAPPPRTLVP